MVQLLKNQVKVEELQRITALKNISPMALEQLASAMFRHTYTTNQIIFLEGDPALGLWFLLEGRIKIIKQSIHGRIQGLCLMQPGKCFGTCPLFGMDYNPATAQAMDDVTLLTLPRDVLENLIHCNPQLASALLQVFSQRLSHLVRLSEKLGIWTVSDRINDCLISYADSRGSDIVVSLTHEKLADLAGTVREVATRHLVRLEQGGIIHIEPGHITVLNLDALRCPHLCKD